MGLVEVGISKMIVSVAVGVSVGVEVGASVDVEVLVAVGMTRAVWVWAAPAVATTIVSRDPGAGAWSGSETAGNEIAGNSHASKISTVAKMGMSFFNAGLSMIHHNTSI